MPVIFTLMSFMHRDIPTIISVYMNRINNGFLRRSFLRTTFIYLRQDENYLKILDTLKKLSLLEIDTLFCNLKGVVRNGKEALLKKIARMEQLRDDVLTLNEKGLLPDKIRKKVLGNEGVMGFVTGGHYSKQNTIDSIISGKRPDEKK